MCIYIYIYICIYIYIFNSRNITLFLGYVKFLMEALLSRLEHGPQQFDYEWENIVANKPPTLTSQLKKGSEPVTKRLSRFSK